MEAIESRIKDLKLRATERETTRYPEDFKEDALALVAYLREKGWTQQAISEAVEIPWVTLRRWREQSSPDDGQPCGFRPVAVVGEKREPVLISPSGWRIEGLTVAQLVDVAGRL